MRLGFNDRELHSLEQIIQTYGCKAGVSAVFSYLTDVPEQYANALTALSINRQLHPEETVSFYQKHIVEHMILKYTEQNDIDYLLHPAVKQLEQLDREKGSDYVLTLFAYLDNFQNLTETSRALHIHHNTLKYRIGKILELTGLDLADPDTVFLLCLSQRVKKIREI